MHLAIITPYPESSNPTLATTLSLEIYTFAIFVSAFIILYIHHHSTDPSPTPCPISQPLPLTNLPTRPCPTLSPSGSLSSQRLGFMPSTLSSLPPLPSSSQSKDSPVTRLMSPVNFLSNSSTTSCYGIRAFTRYTLHFPLPRQSTLSLHRRIPRFTGPTPRSVHIRSRLHILLNGIPFQY